MTRVDRRMFCAEALSLAALGGYAATASGADRDWKTAFRACGFDPERSGSGMFAVVGDPHVTVSDNEPFRAAVKFLNAMSPRPAMLVSVGDQLSHVSMQFGDRATQRAPGWEAETDRECGILKDIVAPLEIPFEHVIGNHDTYPDERDGAAYAKRFPGWRPYRRRDALGIQFLFLNTGHDGWIDPAQKAWIAETKKTLDPHRALMLVGHQPSMNRHRENAIPRLIARQFGDWRGELWFLGGHEHINRLQRFRLPGGGSLSAATHARAPRGFWLYGVRDGTIAARLFVPSLGIGGGAFKDTGAFRGFGSPERGKMPSDIASFGPLPIPFDTTPGVLWKVFVGEDDDKRRYRVECDPQTDAGHWYFYIGRTTYRLPLKAKAPAATKVALLGKLYGHRKTHQPEPVWISGDGRDWTRCPDATERDCVYVYGIPPALRGSEWIYLRVDGFCFGCDSCIAGYALLA